MKMNNRICRILLILATVCFISGCGEKTSSETGKGSAAGDAFPKDAVTITVAYSAGGSSDKLARMLQPYLKASLGADIVVENQNGAGGQIAAEKISRGNNDVYQILAVNVPGLFYTVALQDTTYQYDEFVPVWIESYDPIIMLALKDSPFDNLGAFIEAARENPGKYSVGYVTNSGQQATALWLQKNLDLDIKLVSYDGGSDVTAALLGGHVDAVFSDAYARADIAEEAKALGIGSDKENDVWPQAVSFNEQLKAFDVEMPSNEFQARMGCYFVTSEFAETYPERYDTLVKAFEEASKSEAYIKSLKDANVYSSMVLAPGYEYKEQLETAIKEVKDVVVPLFN